VRIGFIGLGQMGRGMASNLQSSGYDLVVNDLSREIASRHLEDGATWAESPRALGELCDVVFTSLPTPAAVDAVAHGSVGLIAGLRKGASWFDLSTNSVEVVRRLHDELSELDIDFCDAPVSGGPAGASSGKLAIWVGGDEAVFNRYEAVLAAMGDKARYIGPIGGGTIAKLVHNMASTAINAVMAEVLTMGVKAGLDALPLWEAIRHGAAGRMRSFDNVGNRFLPGRLEPATYQLNLMYKDISLALQLAREVNVPMRLCGLVHNDVMEAINRGWGERDSQSFLVLQQERAGVEAFALTAEEIRGVLDRG